MRGRWIPHEEKVAGRIETASKQESERTVMAMVQRRRVAGEPRGRISRALPEACNGSCLVLDERKIFFGRQYYRRKASSAVLAAPGRPGRIVPFALGTPLGAICGIVKLTGKARLLPFDANQKRATRLDLAHSGGSRILSFGAR